MVDLHFKWMPQTKLYLLLLWMIYKWGYLLFDPIVTLSLMIAEGYKAGDMRDHVITNSTNKLFIINHDTFKRTCINKLGFMSFYMTKCTWGMTDVLLLRKVYYHNPIICLTKASFMIAIWLQSWR